MATDWKGWVGEGHALSAGGRVTLSPRDDGALGITLNDEIRRMAHSRLTANEARTIATALTRAADILEGK